MPNKKTHRKTQRQTQRQTRNQDQRVNRSPESPPLVGVYSPANNIVPKKDKSKKKKLSKSNPYFKPVVQTEPVVPVQPVVPKIARPNPLEVKARAAARAAERASAAAAITKRKPPLKPRGARVRVEPPPEPPVTVKRMMPKPKPRTRQTRKTYTYSKPVNMAEFMMESNKPMKKTIPKMSRKSPAFFNIPNGTNELRDAVTEVANSFRVMPVPSGHILNPLLRESANHPLLRGSFMTRKLKSGQVKGMKLNVIKE